MATASPRVTVFSAVTPLPVDTISAAWFLPSRTSKAPCATLLAPSNALYASLPTPVTGVACSYTFWKLFLVAK